MYRHRHLVRSLLALTAGVASIAAAGSVREPLNGSPALFARLDAAGAAAASESAPGVGLAVVSGGRLAYARAFGFADAAHTVRATASTSYVVGSVTKMFTAVSVLQLAERGRLSLDDPIARFVPAFASKPRITLRDLLAHRAGIPDYLPRAVAEHATGRHVEPEELVARIARQPLDFAPGADWNYSNAGYVLLGRAVERASGTSLAEYEARNIFAPAGMTRTAVGRTPPGTVLAQASAGAESGLAAVPANDLSWYYACGDLVSTATDLARFDIALMDGRLLSARSLAGMTRPLTAHTLAPRIGDGLGVFVQAFGDRTLVGHHGGEPGYTSDDEMILPDRFALVVLGNATFSTAPLADAVLQAYYPHQVETAQAAPRAAYDPDPALTARLSRFAAELIAGRLDTSAIAPDLARTLGPGTVAGFPAQFAPFGSFEHLSYVSKAYDGKAKVYTYVATFAAKTLTVVARIDGTGRITQFAFT